MSPLVHLSDLFFPDWLVSFGCVSVVSSEWFPPLLFVCLFVYFLLSPLNVFIEITWPRLYPDCLWQETTVVGSVFTIPAGDKTFLFWCLGRHWTVCLFSMLSGNWMWKPESRAESFALDWILLWQRSVHSKNVPRIVIWGVCVGDYSHAPLNVEKKYRCQTGKL